MSVPRREVVSSATCRPRGVRDTCTTRRSACARCRRIRPLPTSRSDIRPAVDGAISRTPARSPSRCGPSEACTTRARYWAMVISSAAAPSDFVATVISARLALSTASTTPWAAAAGLAAASPATLAHPGFHCLLWHPPNYCTIQHYSNASSRRQGTAGPLAPGTEPITQWARRARLTGSRPASELPADSRLVLDSGDLVGHGGQPVQRGRGDRSGCSERYADASTRPTARTTTGRHTARRSRQGSSSLAAYSSGGITTRLTAPGATRTAGTPASRPITSPAITSRDGAGINTGCHSGANRPVITPGHGPL